MRSISRRVLLLAATFAATIAAVPAALSQDAVDEAAAKAEGRVVWYTSTPIRQAQQAADDFRAETGIEVELFRSGGSAILRRFQQEMQAGLVAVDVLTHSDPGIAESLKAQDYFVPFKPANFDRIPDGAKDPDGHWFAQRLNMIAMYGRTDLAGEMPRTLEDLRDPKFRGKLVMADPNFASLQVAVVGTTAEKLGWDFFEALRENDVMVVQGGQQVVDMVKRGERAIAILASNSYAAEAALEGHPIETVYPPDGTFLIASPTSVVKGSPNPNAAKLFAQFLLSDKQQALFPASGGYGALADMDPPADSPRLDEVTITPVDYDKIEAENAEIKRSFTGVFQ